MIYNNIDIKNVFYYHYYDYYTTMIIVIIIALCLFPGFRLINK